MSFRRRHRHRSPSTEEKHFQTEEQLRKLADRLRAAYHESCEKSECDCITREQHEKMLARR